VITPFFADRYGRKGCLMAMSLMFIVAVIIEVTGQSYWQICMGRFLNAIPQGMAQTMIPVYATECAPASVRGTLVLLYTWFVDAGALTVTGIVYNINAWEGSTNYRLIMGLQLIYPVIILATLPLIPETPRWLTMKGRREEGLAVLKTLRTSKDSRCYTTHNSPLG
jgi:SP family sugar:H+ symporter-like MFS transporter